MQMEFKGDLIGATMKGYGVFTLHLGGWDTEGNRTFAVFTLKDLAQW